MDAVHQVDICILGAGPGGCAAALELARHGQHALLVDKAQFPRDKVCGDALSGKVIRTLERTAPEILPDLLQHPAQNPSWGVTFVAPGGKELRVPFTKKIGEGHAPGAIIPRFEFDALLVNAVKQHAGIELRENTTIRSFARTARGIALTTSDGSKIEARLVIAADGANSLFARHITDRKIEPRHHAAGVRGYFKGISGLDPDGFIELHFLKELLPGYLWVFPLPNGRANVGLGLRSDVVHKRKVDLKGLLDELVRKHPALRQRFQHAEREGPVQGLGLPLGSKRFPLSGDEFMLVGDAGHLIDPFTGEGISHAMISGVKAAEVASEQFAGRRFDAAALQTYDERVWKRLGKELSISTRLQQLANMPWLFDLVVSKAVKNPRLADTISCMFNDLDMRERLKRPGFYWELISGRSVTA